MSAQPIQPLPTPPPDAAEIAAQASALTDQLFDLDRESFIRLMDSMMWREVERADEEERLRNLQYHQEAIQREFVALMYQDPDTGAELILSLTAEYNEAIEEHLRLKATGMDNPPSN